MPSLTIRHVTTYRYRQPVSFGEHRLMFLPRESPDQRVKEVRLEIIPQPTRLNFVEDEYGNHVGIAHFSGFSSELCFESTVRLDHSPVETAGDDLKKAARSFPFAYSSEEMSHLAQCMEQPQSDFDNKVGRWAYQFLPRQTISTFDLLTRVSQGIHRGFRYQRREAKGIQKSVETLRIGQGSCRDFAMLMIDAARTLGFAAKFASGYLAIPLDDEEPADALSRGSTHAWAQIYLPGAGWIDFDPTSGRVGKSSLVTVAVAPDPHHTIPLHGTFIGYAADHLGMDVHVSVKSGTA